MSAFFCQNMLVTVKKYQTFISCEIVTIELEALNIAEEKSNILLSGFGGVVFVFCFYF